MLSVLSALSGSLRLLPNDLFCFWNNVAYIDDLVKLVCVFRDDKVVDL